MHTTHTRTHAYVGMCELRKQGDGEGREEEAERSLWMAISSREFFLSSSFFKFSYASNRRVCDVHWAKDFSPFFEDASPLKQREGMLLEKEKVLQLQMIFCEWK
ncbi:hypothetical protein TGRUB_434240 [Toxoplasma gondii RUB]|uniref:Uncharacterized protein n=1 Tax=Toxoplasma gondii RUB TaxID=935652 RepID=A0A086LIX3_TOXGO|nr:hypothetical protein TGRUB_434240 [Toxoplasma gondii RUB]